MDVWHVRQYWAAPEAWGSQGSQGQGSLLFPRETGKKKKN